MAKSIEEKIEDLCKKQLNSVNYYTKTDFINEEIENALRKYPSKKGGKGANYPDIKLFIETKELKRIPVMIEVKGTKGDFIKVNSNNEIDNFTKDGSFNFNNISKYAVNGSIHYGNAILNETKSYNEVISIGVNGYEEQGSLTIEIGAYYISKDNYNIPKKIDDYDDLSFLLNENIDTLLKQIENINLTATEIEQKTKE